MSHRSAQPHDGEERPCSRAGFAVQSYDHEHTIRTGAVALALAQVRQALGALQAAELALLTVHGHHDNGLDQHHLDPSTPLPSPTFDRHTALRLEPDVQPADDCTEERGVVGQERNVNGDHAPGDLWRHSSTYYLRSPTFGCLPLHKFRDQGRKISTRASLRDILHRTDDEEAADVSFLSTRASTVSSNSSSNSSSSNSNDSSISPASLTHSPTRPLRVSHLEQIVEEEGNEPSIREEAASEGTQRMSHHQHQLDGSEHASLRSSALSEILASYSQAALSDDSDANGPFNRFSNSSQESVTPRTPLYDQLRTLSLKSGSAMVHSTRPLSDAVQLQLAQGNAYSTSLTKEPLRRGTIQKAYTIALSESAQEAVTPTSGRGARRLSGQEMAGGLDRVMQAHEAPDATPSHIELRVADAHLGDSFGDVYQPTHNGLAGVGSERGCDMGGDSRQQDVASAHAVTSHRVFPDSVCTAAAPGFDQDKSAAAASVSSSDDDDKQELVARRSTDDNFAGFSAKETRRPRNTNPDAFDSSSSKQEQTPDSSASLGTLGDWSVDSKMFMNPRQAPSPPVPGTREAPMRLETVEAEGPAPMYLPRAHLRSCSDLGLELKKAISGSARTANATPDNPRRLRLMGGRFRLGRPSSSTGSTTSSGCGGGGFEPSHRRSRTHAGDISDISQPLRQSDMGGFRPTHDKQLPPKSLALRDTQLVVELTQTLLQDSWTPPGTNAAPLTRHAAVADARTSRSLAKTSRLFMWKSKTKSHECIEANARAGQEVQRSIPSGDTSLLVPTAATASTRRVGKLFSGVATGTLERADAKSSVGPRAEVTITWQAQGKDGQSVAQKEDRTVDYSRRRSVRSLDRARPSGERLLPGQSLDDGRPHRGGIRDAEMGAQESSPLRPLSRVADSSLHRSFSQSFACRGATAKNDENAVRFRNIEPLLLAVRKESPDAPKSVASSTRSSSTGHRRQHSVHNGPSF